MADSKENDKFYLGVKGLNFRRLGKKIIVSVKSSILRDFWATDMSRNLSDMHEMYWVFIFDQR